MKLPKYVQAWIDSRDDRAYYYLRRRGFPRARLPGLPWSLHGRLRSGDERGAHCHRRGAHQAR